METAWLTQICCCNAQSLVGYRSFHSVRFYVYTKMLKVFVHEKNSSTQRQSRMNRLNLLSVVLVCLWNLLGCNVHRCTILPTFYIFSCFVESWAINKTLQRYSRKSILSMKHPLGRHRVEKTVDRRVEIISTCAEPTNQLFYYSQLGENLTAA